MDFDRLNVHGGAIALGHPFGSTGTRIMATLINGLQTKDKQFGLESMCVGGGQGMAILVERLTETCRGCQGRSRRRPPLPPVCRGLAPRGTPPTRAPQLVQRRGGTEIVHAGPAGHLGEPVEREPHPRHTGPGLEGARFCQRDSIRVEFDAHRLRSIDPALMGRVDRGSIGLVTAAQAGDEAQEPM